eukprot:3094749-Pyramimonas_sp.AAC.1
MDDIKVFVDSPCNKDESQSECVRAVRRGVLQDPSREKWSDCLTDGTLEAVTEAVKNTLLVLKVDAYKDAQSVLVAKLESAKQVREYYGMQANEVLEQEYQSICDGMQLSHSEG